MISLPTQHGLPARKASGRRALMLAIAAFVAGCTMTEGGDTEAVETAVGPAPMRAVTQMEDALSCLASYYPSNIDLRLAVNDLTDGSGATLSGDSLSRVFTQRPDVMLTVGLAKTGTRLVNRSSIAVAEWELKQAMQKHVGEGRVVRNPADDSRLPYRPILAGSMLGSTHYVSGAISELNWNIYSDTAEAGVGGLSGGARNYRISLAIDLIVTNTRTTEIVMARSYSKQLVGREVGADLFRFFDVGQDNPNWGRNELFEFNIGQSQNEPVQTAVRWVLETAAYEIVSELADIGDICDHLMPEESRPVRTDPAVYSAAALAAARAAAAAGESPVAAARAAALGTTPESAPMADAAAGPRTAAPVQAPVAAASAAGKPAAPTPPDKRPPPPANVIEAINLFDDADAVILRIDTKIPLDRVPGIDPRDPSRLTLDFINASNGIGQFEQSGVAGVAGVRLEERSNGSRVIVDLAEPHVFELARESRSFLVILKPRTAVTNAAGTAEELNVNGAPGIPLGNETGSGGDEPSLAPKETSPVLTDEQIWIQRRR